MKLSYSLLFAAVCAEEAGPSVGPILDELEAYCVKAYTVPAPRTKPREPRAAWTARWTARNRVFNLWSWFHGQDGPFLVCSRLGSYSFVQEALFMSKNFSNYEIFKDVKHNVIESKRFITKYHQQEYLVELLIRKYISTGRNGSLIVHGFTEYRQKSCYNVHEWI